MKKYILYVLGSVALITLGFNFNDAASNNNDLIQDSNSSIYNTTTNEKENMKLGAFSISLSVKDINISKQFYENLGFEVLGGALEQKYLIMKNENSIIGIFQGMFEGNIITFNPGWDENGKNIDDFDDIREIQKNLSAAGIKVDKEIDPSSTGPASLTMTDPDGNIILMDQHR